MTPQISLIVPAYCEEEAIVSFVNQAIDTLIGMSLNFEVIIVDDGSKDDTLKRAQEAFNNNRLVKIISLPENKGYGGAVIEGVKQATKANILTAPVDNPVTPNFVQQYLNTFKPDAIIIGYRKGRKGYHIIQKMLSSGLQGFFRGFYQPKLKDYNWIHWYPKSLWENNAFYLTQTRIIFFAECLLKANHLGYKIIEIPLDHKARNTGRPTSGRVITWYRTMKELYGFIRHFPKWKKALKENTDKFDKEDSLLQKTDPDTKKIVA